VTHPRHDVRTIYRYRWLITDVPRGSAAVVTPITLEGFSGTPCLLTNGDWVDIVAPFGLDLCVRGGHAILESLTNDVTEERLESGINETLWASYSGDCT
jgi:hypothetical protein